MSGREEGREMKGGGAVAVVVEGDMGGRIARGLVRALTGALTAVAVDRCG